MADEDPTEPEGTEPEVEPEELEPEVDDKDAKPAKPAAKPVPTQRSAAEHDADALKDMALKKANREASERRAELKRLQSELDAMKAANASEAEKAVIVARQEATTAAELQWKPAIVAMRAESALTRAGCTDPDNVELILGRIDTAAVDLDDHGQVLSGLDDQVEALKVRYPRMFETPKPARPVSARDVDAGDKKAAPKKLSPGQQLAQRLGAPLSDLI